MPSEWNHYSLAEVGEVVTGKTPSTANSELFGGAVPFVTPSDFDGRKWISSTARTLTECGANAVGRSKIPANAVMVTCIGSDMGKAALAKKTSVPNQQINALIVDESRFCPEFIYYNLSLRKAEIRAMAGGSAQPILNKSHFSALAVACPGLEIQRQIAQTASALDDKIALLRETNATLEAIAQALFKSWFVDFDPVRAKAEGRDPEGVPPEVADLFPSEFEDSELGEIPKGWRVGRLGDVLKQRVERTKPSSQTEQLPYVPIVNADSKLTRFRALLPI